MPALIDDIPVFHFLTTIGMKDGLGRSLHSSSTCTGSLTSKEDMNALLDLPSSHVEMDDTPLQEEVRFVESLTGHYRSAAGDCAKAIIDELKQQSKALFSGAQEIQPGWGFNHEQDFWQRLIIYDEEGVRALPILKHATGLISSIDAFDALQAKEAHCEAIIHDDFAGIAFHRTGEILFADDLVRAAVVERLAVNLHVRPNDRNAV